MCIITAGIASGVSSLGLGAVTAGEVSSGLGLLGAGVSAIGAVSQGNAQSAEASYQAQVAHNNEIIANQNANYAIQAGEAKAAEQGLKTRAAQGRTLAAIAASGIDPNTGSAVDVRQSERELGMVNTERVRQQAALNAYGYRTSASNFGAQSKLDEAESGFATQAGWLKGGGSLLSAASNLPSKFSWFNNSTGDWSPRSDALA